MWKKATKNAKTAMAILKAAGKAYGANRVARMSAAVAYRAIFALAPLVLLAVYVFGLILGSGSTARVEILEAVQQFTGASVEDAMSNVLESVETSGNTAGIVGLLLLLWTGSSLFMEVQNDLNDIFGVPYEHTTGPIAFIKRRGLGFLFAAGLGLVLVAVVLLNSVWQFVGGLFPENLEPLHRLIGFVTPLISLVVLPLVMALTFQVLSSVRVRWKAVWWGSFFTSVAFLAAAYATGLYYRLSGASAATVASSIFVILLLAFVLAAVYLFGAEVTKIYNDYLESGEIGRPGEMEAPGAEGQAEVAVAEPPQPVPLAAVFAFLGGLFVGWRRNR